MKAYWGSGDIDLGTRWRGVVRFTPRPLYLQEKSPWYPLDRRLGGPQSRSEYGGEEKNSQPLPGLEPPDHPARSPAPCHWVILAPPVSIKGYKIRLTLSENACYYSVQNLWSYLLLSKNLNIKICISVILTVVLCGCVNWSVTLRGEQRLRVFENRILRRIFITKR
jgi:hypothetical protein